MEESERQIFILIYLSREDSENVTLEMSSDTANQIIYLNVLISYFIFVFFFFSEIIHFKTVTLFFIYQFGPFPVTLEFSEPELAVL